MSTEALDLILIIAWSVYWTIEEIKLDLVPIHMPVKIEKQRFNSAVPKVIDYVQYPYHMSPIPHSSRFLEPKDKPPSHLRGDTSCPLPSLASPHNDINSHRYSSLPEKRPDAEPLVVESPVCDSLEAGHCPHDEAALEDKRQENVLDIPRDQRG